MIFNYIESYLESHKYNRDKERQEYMERMTNHYIDQSKDYAQDLDRMIENYNIKNGRLRREDYVQLCTVTGSGEESLALVDNYNLINNAISVLKGEELKRPFPFAIASNSQRIRNRIEREKTDMLLKYSAKIFNIEMEKAKRMMELESQNLSEEEAQEKMEQLEKEFENRYDGIQDIASIISNYESIANIEEATANKLIKALYKKFDFKKIKNRCFEHLIISGYEFVEIYSNNKYQVPRIAELNPLDVFYSKTNNIEYIEDAQYAGRRSMISPDQAIDKWGEYLDDDKIREIFSYRNTMGYGNDDFVFDGSANNPFKRKRVNDPTRSGYSHTSSRHYRAGIGTFVDPDGANFITVNSNATLPGLHSSTYGVTQMPQIEEIVLYWKSIVEIGKVTYINEYNEVDYTFTTSDFVVPSDAKKVITKPTNTGVPTIEWEWTDHNGNPIKLEWIKVNTVNKSVKLGNTIIVCEPLKDVYRSLKDPYQVKLPINGVAMNNINTYPVSYVDMMKPWQKLFTMMMARFLRTIKLDRGTVLGLNLPLLTSTGYEMEKVMSILDKQNIFLYDSLSAAQDPETAYLAQGTPITNVDISSHNTLQRYMEILQFIQNNLIESAGLNPQRMANSSEGNTATDNTRDMQTSQTITEPVFYLHDCLWESIMRSYMETVFTFLTDSSGMMESILNDEEKVLIDLSLIDIRDNYNLIVTNVGRNRDILEIVQQQVLSLIQNQMITLPQMINMLYTDDIIELKNQAIQYDLDQKEHEKQMQMSEQEHEVRMEQERRKTAEDAQIHENWLKYMDNTTKMYIEKFKAMALASGMDTQKDYNKDGVADYMQIEQIERKLELEERKTALKERELQDRHNAKMKELDIKENNTQESNSVKQTQLSLQQAEMDARTRLEREKLEAAREQRNNTNN